MNEYIFMNLSESFMASNIYLIHLMSNKRNRVRQMKCLLITNINNKILIGAIDFDFNSI